VKNNSDGIAAIGFGLGDKIELTKKPSIFSSCFFILTKTNGKLSLQLRLRDQ
jgi:single-stranded-DNA-specific exonuclease